jgi:hypothetical protein
MPVLSGAALGWLEKDGGVPMRRMLAVAVMVLHGLGVLAFCGETLPCVWTNVERVVAVGDVHGDFEQFVLLLKSAGVVDERYAWTGGKTHLVQTGDILGRGPESKKAMDLLMTLEEQAAKAGGRVHALIGNHEAMVMNGEYSYLHQGEIDALGGMESLKRAFSTNGIYGKWIRGHNAVIRINDTVFLHGGLSLTYAKQTLPVLNDTIRRELALELPPEDGVVMANDGPLWWRGLALAKDQSQPPDLEEILAAVDASRVVVGHTIQKDGIQSRCEGKIIMVDVGMSRTYAGGAPACLLIEKGELLVVTPGGRAQLRVR